MQHAFGPACLETEAFEIWTSDEGNTTIATHTMEAYA